MHHPRKNFGQNFLTDQTVIQNILQAINIKPNEHIVEIGPGLGALTTELIKLTSRFDAIEIDRDLVGMLTKLFVNYPGAKLYSADALSFDFASLSNSPYHSLRIIGNLPYNISTPLLFHLLSFAGITRDMHFMLQREVAERLAATVSAVDFDAKSYGRLSVMVQYHCKIEVLFDVPPSAFSPTPKVYSSFVRLIPFSCSQIPFIANDLKIFADVVRTAFNQRRKTISNSLRKLISKSELQNLHINPEARPEQLSVEQFVLISNFIVVR